MTISWRPEKSGKMYDLPFWEYYEGDESQRVVLQETEWKSDLLVAFCQPFVDVFDARVRRSGGGKGLGVVFANPWQFTGILLR